MAFGLIMIMLCLVLFLLGLVAMLSNLDSKHPTKSLPPAPTPAPKKTIAEMLKEALASPPIGCMWEVRDVVKHSRKLPNGREVFDGTVDYHFAQVTFISPGGERDSFSLKVDDEFFEHNLKYSVQVVLAKYNKQLESKKKVTETGWDGVYH